MMLGYDCPCCGSLITQSKPREMRDCLECAATVSTQRKVKEKRNA
jgi:hypothetical protein